MSAELVVTPPADLEVHREPTLILEEAGRAARALQEVIAKKAKPVRFNGEQYLEFEDWQTIGKFYGLSCLTLKPNLVTIEGVVGAEAHAEVIETRTGKIVGRASAWCLRDEPNWRNKPWYQLGSMAQTRAGAKALRNLLSWVVVLAGFKTTPAEEMADDVKEESRKPEQQRLPIKEGPVEDILTRLFTMWGGDQEKVEEYLKSITIYKNKNGEEKWLTTLDLDRVAQHKPQWIERIYKKILMDTKEGQ